MVVSEQLIPSQGTVIRDITAGYIRSYRDPNLGIQLTRAGLHCPGDWSVGHINQLGNRIFALRASKLDQLHQPAVFQAYQQFPVCNQPQVLVLLQADSPYSHGIACPRCRRRRLQESSRHPSNTLYIVMGVRPDY